MWRRGSAWADRMQSVGIIMTLDRNSDALRSFTYDDVLQFLAAQGVKFECSSCGKRKWTVSIGKNAEPVHLLPSYNPSNTHMPYQAVVYMECTHCGYLRLYSHFRIMTWVLDRDSGRGAAGGQSDD